MMNLGIKFRQQKEMKVGHTVNVLTVMVKLYFLKGKTKKSVKLPPFVQLLSSIWFTGEEIRQFEGVCSFYTPPL